jgi:hypothetical protein|tara:strand:- start:1892 stop:2794 length:903 start_codon:yes stop_codon:yes gene_type:complete
MAEAINYLSNLVDLMKAPLFSRVAKEYGYGARKGLDIADIIDIPIRAAQSIAAPVAQVAQSGRGALSRMTMPLPALVGEPYTPETIAGPLQATGTTDEEGISVKFDPGEESAGYDWEKDELIFGLQNPYNLEPSVVYEELAHARGHRRDYPITGLKPKAIETGSEALEYLATIPEETRAKAVALKDVFTREGILEGLLSIPGSATSLLSYLLPTPQHFVQPSRISTKTGEALEYMGREPFGRTLMRMKKQPWESMAQHGKTRVEMAQSSNPIEQLMAYFGIQPKKQKGRGGVRLQIEENK